MQKQSILLRGTETHILASKQISLPVPAKTGPVQKGKGDASPESWEAGRDPQMGLYRRVVTYFFL